MRVLAQLAQLVQARYLRIGGRRAGRPVWEAVEPARVGEDAAGGSLLQHGGGNACCRLIPPMSPGGQGCGRRPAQLSRRPGGPRRGRPASDPRARWAASGDGTATGLGMGSDTGRPPRRGSSHGRCQKCDHRRTFSIRKKLRSPGWRQRVRRAPRTYEWLGHRAGHAAAVVLLLAWLVHPSQIAVSR